MKKNQYKREVLYNEIWQQPVTTVAKKYGVSDVAIRKVCKSMNIPMPPRGYWAKLAAGQKVERTPLPKNYDGLDEKLGRRPNQWSCGHTKVDALDIDDEQISTGCCAPTSLCPSSPSSVRIWPNSANVPSMTAFCLLPPRI